MSDTQAAEEAVGERPPAVWFPGALTLRASGATSGARHNGIDSSPVTSGTCCRYTKRRNAVSQPGNSTLIYIVHCPPIWSDERVVTTPPP
ncbi:hypothetical protein J6590_045887 [Homalodisca vitripennis]|nr:hypothetical protein J6590_045887 [Homalodisca vitripennis]